VVESESFMVVRSSPAGAPRRALASWPGVLAAAVIVMLGVSGCAADARCTSNAECETGQVCSNEKNPQGAGVCIDPCVRHPNTAACIDASVAAIDAAVTVDAGVDAAIDASSGVAP
jgi:hypothetical protein